MDKNKTNVETGNQQQAAERRKFLCQKCLEEWEADRLEDFEECPLKAGNECLVSQAISLRSFA